MFKKLLEEGIPVQVDDPLIGKRTYIIKLKLDGLWIENHLGTMRWKLELK
jgi:hypothetical protein